MAVLRLFAQAREAAGTGKAAVPGNSVGEVLDEASRRYGTAFDDVVATSKVWLNGQPVGREASVDGEDEVAVLPPISGGFR